MLTTTENKEFDILEQYVQRFATPTEPVSAPLRQSETDVVAREFRPNTAPSDEINPVLANEIIPALISRYQSLHDEMSQLTQYQAPQKLKEQTRQHKGSPSIIFAVERTNAAWAKMSIWVFTIGMLAMNSNQMIAAAELGVRLQAPVFVIGFLLALIGIVGIPYHLYIYEKRMQLFTDSDVYGNRRGIYMTSFMLFIVMLFALLGSAIYGATEVVQVA